MKITRRSRRAARALYRICLVDGQLDEQRVRTAARHLGGSRQHGALPLLSAFQRLVRLDQDRHTAHVESATLLDETMREALRRDVTHAYGASVATAFTENADLIGGIRIKIGSDVYDGSVRARLNDLASRL